MFTIKGTNITGLYNYHEVRISLVSLVSLVSLKNLVGISYRFFEVLKRNSKEKNVNKILEMIKQEKVIILQEDLDN